MELIDFELFADFKKIPYFNLIERYIRQYNGDKLTVMAMQCLSTMPENVQMDVAKVVEYQLLSIYAMAATQPDCEDALIFFMQSSGMNDILDKYYKNNLHQEEKVFVMDIFRIISLTHANLAYSNKELRKLLGIKKSLFFR
jgi:hypothetical protein